MGKVLFNASSVEDMRSIFTGLIRWGVTGLTYEEAIAYIEDIYKVRALLSFFEP
jgi:hypothetical protein